jgi:hypothetical protein
MLLVILVRMQSYMPNNALDTNRYPPLASAMRSGCLLVHFAFYAGRRVAVGQLIRWAK